MKKAQKNTIVTTILTLLVVAIVAIAGICITNAVKDKRASDADVICKVDKLENGDVYTLGDKIGLRLRANSDTQLLKFFYVINGEKTYLEPLYCGESSTFEDERLIGNKKYSIDTGVVTIDTTNMNTGFYAFMAYAEDVEGNSYVFDDKAIVFQIVEAPVEDVIE